MSQEFHILNGDALHERIGDLFHGSFIICREALIEGPINSKDFHKHRASFHDISLSKYHEVSTSQFEAIKLIPDASEINLWFEDDLFCQCNLWYIVNLILSIPLKANVYLVRPNTDSWLGFGIMDENHFAKAYQNRKVLSQEDLITFQLLWKIYSEQVNGDLLKSAIGLEKLIPRIQEVIQAHLDRLPPKNRPLLKLKSIMEKNKNKSFPAIFKTFSEEEGIYGFGDTSIKHLYDQLKEE